MPIHSFPPNATYLHSPPSWRIYLRLIGNTTHQAVGLIWVQTGSTYTTYWYSSLSGYGMLKSTSHVFIWNVLVKTYPVPQPTRVKNANIWGWTSTQAYHVCIPPVGDEDPLRGFDVPFRIICIDPTAPYCQS